EAAFEAPGIQVIEEQAADAPGFVAMAQVEVVITPLLETGIDILAKGRAGSARYPVPVETVCFVGVIGRQVETTAEPPYRLSSLLLGNEEAHVGVGGGHMGVVRVHDQGHAHGLETAASQLRTVGGG